MSPYLRTNLQPQYHRLWRLAAKRMTVQQRRDWLPGYPWLELGVWSWVKSAPAQRSDLITELFAAPDDIYWRAVTRAGGIHSAVRLVCAGRETEIPWHQWKVPSNPEPTLDDIAGALIQISHAIGVRL